MLNFPHLASRLVDKQQNRVDLVELGTYGVFVDDFEMIDSF